MAKGSMLVIVGPTASGKTSRAVACARKLHGEIVSADSRQVYRGMDIGTGKDMGEYGDVAVHMIDIVPAGYKYNLYEYLRDANAAIDDIKKRGYTVIVAGGTGMYAEALLNGLRLPEVPENRSLREQLEGKTLEELTEILASMKTLHNTTDVDTAKRAIRAIEIATYYREHPEAATAAVPNKVEGAVTVCVDPGRDERRRRISARLHKRLEEGMVDEVRGLLESGIDAETLIYYGLEYKYITEYLLGSLDYKTMVEKLEIAIHQFAKRQMTWWRGMERRGHTVHYFAADMPEDEFTEKAGELMRI